ncbi:MAG TPA: class I SAM-dependent methyltransferase [Candidatus Bathyarchaeia archaeon]|nr:class I SAM-dependent methyltransferase [Candidatus Bathyarchaeia archaeon]
MKESITDSLEKIRSKWFEGSPSEKRGVTERYVVFGEARRWIIEQLSEHLHGLVLDLGFGHGFLSYEIVVRARANVVGVDFLRGDQLRIAQRGAYTGQLRDRISLVVGDASKLPFAKQSFDCIVSFLFLEDVSMTSGREALSNVITDSLRSLKPGGIFALSDNMFPECANTKSQRLYYKIQNEVFHAGLPSSDSIISILKAHDLHDINAVFHDPKIQLTSDEARIELQDIVEAEPFGKKYDFGEIWRKYRKIASVGLAYPRVLLLSGRK